MKTATLAFASIMLLSVYGETGGDNFRPYISTSLAKIVMAGDNEATEECDGSGWITHGDGHKTECPGCSACENQAEIKSNQDVCTCGCNKTECKCQSQEVKKKITQRRPIIRKLFGR